MAKKLEKEKKKIERTVIKSEKTTKKKRKSSESSSEPIKKKPSKKKETKKASKNKEKKKVSRKSKNDDDSQSDNELDDYIELVLPGQKKATPPAGDATRAFYESLIEQRPDSLMAKKYLVEYGCLEPDKAKEFMKAIEKAKNKKK